MYIFRQLKFRFWIKVQLFWKPIEPISAAVKEENQGNENIMGSSGLYIFKQRKFWFLNISSIILTKTQSSKCR